MDARDSVRKDRTKRITNEVKYPKSIYSLSLYKFGERFSYHGIRAVLVFYIVSVYSDTNDSENKAAVIYHSFICLTNFLSFIGGYISDVWLGKFRTIIVMSICNLVGMTILIFSSLEVSSEGRVSQSALLLIGLLVISLGVGGILTCDVSLGGDQFQVPQQQPYMDAFFSNFYICINVSGFLALAVMPWIRASVSFFAVFVTATVVFLMATAVMVASQSLFVRKKPTRCLIQDFCHCIWIGIKGQGQSSQVPQETHNAVRRTKRLQWLNSASANFDEGFIQAVKEVLNVALIFTTYPLFYALFDQLGSRWTFQASRMDGKIGAYTFLPDQMQIVNTVLIIVFVKLFDLWVYPFCLVRLHLLKKPLQKIIIGGIVLSAAFLASAVLQHVIDQKGAIQETEAQLFVFSKLKNCNVSTNASSITKFESKPSDNTEILLTIDTMHNDNEALVFVAFCPQNLTFQQTFKAQPGKRISVFLWNENETLRGHICRHPDLLTRPQIRGLSFVRLIYAFPSSSFKLDIVNWSLSFNNNETIEFEAESTLSGDTEAKEVSIPSSGSQVKIICVRWRNESSKNIEESCASNDEAFDEYDFHREESYAIFVRIKEDHKGPEVVHVESLANQVHILWQLPQYALLTMAEVMFSIPSIQFAYTQAPECMKSVLQAFFRLTMALGNLLDILVMLFLPNIFKNQALEFFFFAILMFLDMLLLAVIARKYEYKEENEAEQRREN